MRMMTAAQKERLKKERHERDVLRLLMALKLSYSIPEIAELLSRTPTTMYRWFEAGPPNPNKLSRSTLIEVIRHRIVWLDRRAKNNPLLRAERDSLETLLKKVAGKEVYLRTQFKFADLKRAVKLWLLENGDDRKGVYAAMREEGETSTPRLARAYREATTEIEAEKRLKERD